MGADGWLTILAADIVDSHSYNPYIDFHNVYERMLLGQRVYTVYEDNMGLPSYPTRQIHSFKDYDKIGAVIDTWHLWT